MPAWFELLNQAKELGSTYDVIRRQYLKALHEATGRNIITYYSGWLQKPPQLTAQIPPGISDADKNGFMSVIHGLDRSKGLDLLLHTPGGNMAATESLVDYLKLMFGNDIRAVIPQIAMSGGTIMALACKEIIMGKESSIGPIDPQFGSMAATGLLEEFERIRKEIKKDPSNAYIWQPILSKIQPGMITECENVIEWSHKMAERFLGSNMFYRARNKKQKIAKIIKTLTDKQNTKTHGRHIGLEEAQGIFGDKVIALESDDALQDAILTVHHSCIMTLDATEAYKIIENHEGRAFVQRVRMTVQTS